MHSHALHPIPSAQLVCSFHFPISSPQLVCSSHLLISSAQLISSAHLVCQARKFFSYAHVVFPARRFLSLAHLVCPTNHPSMTPCASQTVAAAHRRAARAIHHDDATSPYPSAMDLYVTCKTCHPILSPRRPRRAPIPTPEGVLSGCRSRRGEQQRHPAVNVGTSARPSAPSPNPNARWPNVRRPWLTLTLTPFPQVGEALLSDRELAFAAVFYFAPASSTASVAAIRDRTLA